MSDKVLFLVFLVHQKKSGCLYKQPQVYLRCSKSSIGIVMSNNYVNWMLSFANRDGGWLFWKKWQTTNHDSVWLSNFTAENSVSPRPFMRSAADCVFLSSFLVLSFWKMHSPVFEYCWHWQAVVILSLLCVFLHHFLDISEPKGLSECLQ